MEQEEGRDQAGGKEKEEAKEKELQQKEQGERKKIPYACNYCYKECTSKEVLGIHVRTQHKDPGACSTCGKAFSSSRKIRAHMKQVHGKAIFPCRKCSKGFKTPGNRKRHELRCGAAPARAPACRPHKASFACPLCHLAFSSYTKLRKHMKTHNLVLRKRRMFLRSRQAARARVPWMCSVCGVSYTQKYNLIKHQKKKHPKAMQRHEVEKPSCNICAAELGSWKDLEEHRREEHVGERCYACSQCEKAFHSQKNLAMHSRRVHTSIVFTCKGGEGGQGCGKTFKEPRSLTRHLERCAAKKSFEELSSWGKAHRARKKAEAFTSQLRALGGEERRLVLRKMAVEDPTLLDFSPSNPLSMDDIIGVSN